MRSVVRALAFLVYVLAVLLTAPSHPQAQDATDTNPDPLDAARGLIQQGKYADAESAAQALLEQVREEHGTESAEAATVMDVLVESRWRGGKAQDPETRELAEQVIALKEQVLGPEHLDVSESLTNLGVIGFFLGDFETAGAAWERALTLRESTLGPDDPAVAQILNNLGNLATNIGDLGAARDLNRRALAIREKAFGAEHPLVAGSLGNLGYLEEAVGNLQGAMQLHERAVAIREKVLEADDPQLALSLHNLASVRAKVGNYENARPLFEQALEIRRKALGPEHPLVAETLNGLALLAARTGHTAQALGFALDAERIARDHLRLTGRSLSEESALRYANIRQSGLDLALSLAVQGLEPSSLRPVLDAVIRSRAVVLDGIAARSRTALRADDPKIARLVESLTAARAKLANMTVRGPGRLDAATYRELLEQAREDKDRAERGLAVASADFAREQERSRIGLDEVAASLPAGSALVALTVYERQDVVPVAQDGASSKTTPVPSYLAIVLPSGKEPAIVDLGPAEQLERLVSSWKKEVSTGVMLAGRTPESAEAAYRRSGGRLREKLWDPLTSQLRDTRRVFVVPDGALNLVSFASLPVDTMSYLIEKGPLVHYVSAERDLVPSASATDTGEGLLALGGPDYDAGGRATPGTSSTMRATRASCGGFEKLHFDALPATAREATEVTTLWREAGQEDADVKQLLHLSGSGASEASFKTHAPGRRVLHLATHGFFLGGDCASAAGMRGIGGLAPAATEPPPPPAPTMSPLLLSGLALSGANQRRTARSDEEDGILTAEEIAALDLSGVEWAVLSACDTALGEIQAGEGVFGLRRAMSIAGVRSLIMSLWSVDDEATREWMRALYEGRFRRGLDTAEATREAGLSVLEARRRAGQDTHPVDWAAFVAIGDWR